MLAALGLALVSGGASPEAMKASARIDARSAQDEMQRIAAIMQEANPTLTDRESARIGRAVLGSASRFGLDPELVSAVLLVESGARPWARSPKGAIGLMQVMPHMASGMRIAGNLTTIESNIEAGCWILSGNIRRLGEETASPPTSGAPTSEASPTCTASALRALPFAASPNPDGSELRQRPECGDAGSPDSTPGELLRRRGEA
jgi:hypothetical protein